MHPPATCPAEPPSAAPPPRDDEAMPAGLSNDYLNHFSEALMLIELAAADPGIAADLAAWRPVGYRAHFEASRLRRAGAAIAAYDALDPAARAGFEELTGAMNRLVRTAVLALQPPCEAEDAAIVAVVTAPALRRLVGRAGAFLASGGADLAHEGEIEEAQTVIDRLIERAGSGD
ncbi:hypothetical protein [Salinarimonas soli]|uniref:Uncharacterized protein n=1 Tax=Salinarimonas soli TaxID=1638099 RepID=A0A5B2W0F9_9HYPH|nr:hypothetical protein [Salinarimonas soli]KAA2244200.1 hypothetical protein F0L46_00685 [Salinarimonas soli]